MGNNPIFREVYVVFNLIHRRVEMNKILLASMLALGITLVSNPAMARRGADDNVPGNVHQCRGCDDPPGHIRGGHGADDPAGHMRQGRGADDPVGHVRGGHGADDPAGDDRGRGRGRGADDGPNHQ
jgi:hypothetical protein